MKSISLVLSGGAARGLAHIGAIEELEDQDYFISSITGCSMGALVGGDTSLAVGLHRSSDYHALLEYCRQFGIEIVYAHDAHNAGPKLTKLFRQLRKAGIKTATEIPPHPYDKADNTILTGRLGQWINKHWRQRLYHEMTAVVTFSDEEQLFDQRTILINCPDNTGSSADGTTWRQEMQRVVDALMG